MDKVEATRYLRRFYYQLRNDTTLRAKIQRDPEFAGLWEPHGRTRISINPDKRRAGTFAAVIIHELLHEIEYDMPHSRLVPLEKAIYAALTDRQLTNLVKRVFS